MKERFEWRWQDLSDWDYTNWYGIGYDYYARRIYRGDDRIFLLSKVNLDWKLVLLFIFFIQTADLTNGF